MDALSPMFEATAWGSDSKIPKLIRPADHISPLDSGEKLRQ